MTTTAAQDFDTNGSGFTRRQTLVILGGPMLGLFLGALDQTIVATALPTITSDLGGLNHLSWVFTSYLLASTVSTPLFGKLGDLYGRKHLLQLAIVVFVVGSVACGLARSMPQLIAFRTIQGLGGGGLMALAEAVIADVVPARERGRYHGYFGAVFGAASVTGPLLGGFLSDSLSWRWAFYVNVPFGIAALVATTIALPNSERRRQVTIDYAGAIILTAAATAVILVTTLGGATYPWGSPIISGLIAATIVFFIALMIVERRAVEPVLPIHLFRVRNFSIALVVYFVVGITFFGAIVFLPLFLQVVTGATATNSGVLIIPLMLGMVSGTVISGQVVTRTGRYKVFPTTGTLLMTFALVLLGSMTAHTGQATVVIFMILLGTGIGMALPAALIALQNSIAQKDLGSGTSSTNFFRALGGSIGLAVLGSIFNAQLTNHLRHLAIDVGSGSSVDIAALRGLPAADRARVNVVFADAVTGIFHVVAPLALVAMVITWFLKEIPLKTTVDAQPTAALFADC